MGKIKIRVKKPWIGYPGSTIQQNYSESLDHGYLLWDIENREKFDVSFVKLTNPKPYVTIDWCGTVEKTVKYASQFPKQSRFRIKSVSQISQRDVYEIIEELKQTCLATEVTFKNDQKINKDIITTNKATLDKSDLRNSDVVLSLLKDHYSLQVINENVTQQINEQLKNYLVSSITKEEVVRNTQWFIRHLAFDNMFSYGLKNSINFDSLKGVVGIFGPNRIGKSSIVGTIMYSLFNTTDRGPTKNLNVCNARKPFCYTKMIINVNGVDYVIERQTTKNENKQSIISASTSLNVCKIDNQGNVIDLVGEQRTDTEKVIRGLIGTADDFLLTSIASQGEMNQFISQGSTKRRQILSRFLDLDIFDKMYDQSNKDLGYLKGQLRNYTDRDWVAIADNYKTLLQEITNKIEECVITNNKYNARLDELKSKLASHNDYKPVTKLSVTTQQDLVNNTKKKHDEIVIRLENVKTEINKIDEKIKTLDDLKSQYDLVTSKKRFDEFKIMTSTVTELNHLHEKELLTLKLQERSLKILDEVPCDDKFPTCKFIKDAHSNKLLVDDQRKKTLNSLKKLNESVKTLNDLSAEDVKGKLEKIEKIYDLHSKLSIDLSRFQLDLVKIELEHTIKLELLTSSTIKLNELEEALKNDENAEVVSIRAEIDDLVSASRGLDDEKMKLASSKGHLFSDITKTNADRLARDNLLEKMKAYELISGAFSKRGIPSSIISSQLPIINIEIAKILQGIVDFTVELETDEESESMEVFINYGDGKRLIELSSGMEKIISSIAIRTALINISSLPKTDLLVIDEGFGTLDESGIESCNRLLSSLKRYFKTILVISHIDGVKDAVDNVIEISKIEKDAKVVYE